MSFCFTLNTKKMRSKTTSKRTLGAERVRVRVCEDEIWGLGTLTVGEVVRISECLSY